jgi:sugar-specific transcriptional regulator TrmB
MIQEFLHSIGLSDKETDLYLELLKYEFLSPTEISRKTGINRTTVYPILDQLMQKRLVREVEGSKKGKYMAESPERLKTYFQEKMAKFEEQERLLDDVIPQLRGLEHRDSNSEPVVKYYTGRQGVLDSLHDYLEIIPNGTEISMIYSQDFVERMFTPTEAKTARALRIKRNLAVKTIYSYSKGEKEEVKGSTRVKLPENYSVLGDIAFTDDAVRFYSGEKDLFGIIVRSKEIAQTLKVLHELAYLYLKEKENKE